MSRQERPDSFRELARGPMEPSAKQQNGLSWSLISRLDSSMPALGHNSELVGSTKKKGQSPESGILLVTAQQDGKQSTLWLLPTILHADWSNRPCTAFRRWTQAVHQVAAIQVSRHRFLACPYRFLAAKRQAKADLSSGHSHDRTTFESFAPDSSEQPDQNLTDLFDTRNHGSQGLSARYQHTRHGLIPCLMS